MLKGIMSFYDEGRACMRVGNMVSESVLVKMVLRQGCVMLMDGLVREVYSRVNGMGIKMSEREIQHSCVLNNLNYAIDDQSMKCQYQG